MIMILNDVLTRQNVFTKIVLKDGDKELSKELKVKVMRIRMAYTKVKKAFDAEVQEFTEELVPEELKNLNSKEERTEEENARLQELTNKVNSEYQEFLIQKGNEEIKDEIDDSFTMAEYSDIVDVNSGNDVDINGNTIKAVDFLEIIYDLFVKE
jgi:folate-binding Fe-S cluster repair protein YgfZ